MAKYEYIDRDRETVRRAQKQSDSKYDKYLDAVVSWYKPRIGENCIRLVPWLNKIDKEYEKYIEDWGKHWGITITLHWGVGPNNGSYLCLEKMQNVPCPICDVWRLDSIADLEPVDRILCWLVDRKDERAGLQLWAMPLSVSRDISIASERKKTGEMVAIDNWDKGFDVFFDAEGEKDRRKYKRVQLDNESSYLAEDEAVQDKLLDAAFEKRLPDMLKFYPADYLEKVLTGQKAPEDQPNDRGSVRDRRRPTEDSSGDREEASARTGRSREGERDSGRSERRAPPDADAGQSDRRARRGGNGDGASADAADRIPWEDKDKTEGGESPRQAGRRGEAPERDRKAESENEAKEARSSRKGDAERDQARERLQDVGREGRSRRR